MVGALASAGDLANEIEILLAQRFGEFMNHTGEEAGGARVHVLDRVNAEAVKVGKSDPVLIDLAQALQRGRNNVLVDLVLAVGHDACSVIQVFEAEKIAIQK